MINPKTQQRELAYIVQVNEVKELEGYDRIAHYRVNEWWCVAGKGDYKVGDLAVYIEIDSLCPYTEEFKFLDSVFFEDGTKKPDRHKIKTQRFCKGRAISQGLLCPLNNFPGLKDCKEGDFVTERLGVTYYEPEDNVRKASNKKLAELKADKFMERWIHKHKLLSKLKFICSIKRKIFLSRYFKNQIKKKTNWPYWVAKTDEERCLGANTKIDTDQGLLRIADIVMKKLPVRVKSYNENANKIEYKPIVDYQHYNKERGYFEIKVPFSIGSAKRSKTIRCTPDHKFYVGSGIYKKASELHADDAVYTLSYTHKGREILEFIYGNILGDGHLYREGDLVRFNFSQGESHKEYLDILFNAYNGGHYLSEKNGFNKNKVNYRFELINTALLTKDIDECGIFTGKKWSVNEEFCNKLTWRSLATWYMDDGSIVLGNQAPSAMLHTKGYSHEEQLLLIKTLQNKFNLNSNINRDKRGYEYIRITCGSSKDFFENIAPYVVPSMQYKLPEHLRRNQNYLGGLKYLFDYVLLPTKIKSIKYVDRYMESYDIEVKDNHNFFAGGVLTHNCQNLPELFKDNNKHYIATEKIDGTSTTFTMLQAPKGKRKAMVCSRNVVFDTPEKEEKNFYRDTDGNVYLEMFEKYRIEEVLNKVLSDHPEYSFITIQGETYGGTIQKRNYGPEHKLAIFNIIFQIGNRAPERLNTIQMRNFIRSINRVLGTDLECVPIIHEDFMLPDSCEELLKIAEGKSLIDGQPREGLVFRDKEGKESFKAVSNTFLEKYHN